MFSSLLISAGLKCPPLHPVFGLDEDPFFDRFNYEAVGGSPILGINDNAIIGHGRSTPRAICNMLVQGYEMAASGIVEHVRATFKS